MRIFEFPAKSKKTILAIGAESAGNFSVFHSGKIHFSEDFGDLLEEKNYNKFKKSVLNFLKKNKLKPDIILTDLHPEYKITLWGKKLSKKFKAKCVQIQHHIAHIFSAIGEAVIGTEFPMGSSVPFVGIALDGTGYGTDGKIWGGEIFHISPLIKGVGGIKRIGHLENQIMIGGDLAVKEPARMLLAILARIKNYELRIKNNKEFIYNFVKKYYSRNQFELLYSQLEQNFNCVETSSAGRILDAVSVILGFAKNERNYKHEPIMLLEQNSTLPFNNLKPKITSLYNKELRITNYELSTTYLFEYLLKNLHKNKKRLAATAQLYIAQGIYQIISKLQITPRFGGQANYKLPVYFAGGIANNKIISSYLKSKGVIANKKVPSGDAGLSFGQVFYYLLADGYLKASKIAVPSPRE